MWQRRRAAGMAGAAGAAAGGILQLVERLLERFAKNLELPIIGGPFQRRGEQPHRVSQLLHVVGSPNAEQFPKQLLQLVGAFLPPQSESHPLRNEEEL
eukprot:6748240-Prymnesium_polylepis.1